MLPSLKALAFPLYTQWGQCFFWSIDLQSTRRFWGLLETAWRFWEMTRGSQPFGCVMRFHTILGKRKPRFLYFSTARLTTILVLHPVRWVGRKWNCSLTQQYHPTQSFVFSCKYLSLFYVTWLWWPNVCHCAFSSSTPEIGSFYGDSVAYETLAMPLGSGGYTLNPDLSKRGMVV